MKTTKEVRLEDVRVYAYHGYYDIERVIGTEFSVDVRVRWESGTPVKDVLARTVDYEDLYRIIEGQMMIPSRLLETVSARIADEIHHAHPFVEEIEVTIHKPVQLGGTLKRASVTEKKIF